MFKLTNQEWETFKRRHNPEVFTKAMMDSWIEGIKEDLIKAETGETLDEPTTKLVNSFREELQSFQKVTVIKNPENNVLNKGLVYDTYYIRPQQVEWIENDVIKSETDDINKSKYGKYKDTELNRKLDRVGLEFGKAIETDIEKGKAANIGDIHTWNGKKFKKQPNGKWLEVSELHELTKKEHEEKRDGVLNSKYFSNTEKEEMKEVTRKHSSHLSDKEHSDEEVGLGGRSEIKVGDEVTVSNANRYDALAPATISGTVLSIDKDGRIEVKHNEGALYVNPKDISKQSSEKKEDNIEIGQTYHAPASDGGEAIDFTITSIKDGKYTIETSNKEGRKGEHTFDEDTLRDLISESKLKSKSK